MTTTFQMQPSGIPIIPKSPDEVLDYTEDWYKGGAGWLAPGETIASFGPGPIVSPPAGLTVTQSQITAVPGAPANTAVTAWLSGGVIGTVYLVTVKIVTTAGRTGERSFQVGVSQR